MPKFLQRHGLQSSTPAALPVTRPEFFPQNVPVIRQYDWALRASQCVLLLSQRRMFLRTGRRLAKSVKGPRLRRD